MFGNLRIWTINKKSCISVQLSPPQLSKTKVGFKLLNGKTERIRIYDKNGDKMEEKLLFTCKIRRLSSSSERNDGL